MSEEAREQAIAEVSCSNAWDEAAREFRAKGLDLADLGDMARPLFRVGFMMGALFGSNRVRDKLRERQP